MKKTLALFACLALCTSAAAADAHGQLRAELRAQLDAPRDLARPSADAFLPAYTAANKSQVATKALKTHDARQRRADALYQAAWVVPPPNGQGSPRTTLAHLMAAATRTDQVGNDALLYLVRTPDVRAALGGALRAHLAKLSSPDLRTQRLPVERAVRVCDEMDKSTSTTSQEWGAAFRELLKALR